MNFFGNNRLAFLLSALAGAMGNVPSARPSSNGHGTNPRGTNRGAERASQPGWLHQARIERAKAKRARKAGRAC